MSGSKPSWYLIDSNVFLRFLVRDEERTWKDCVNFFHAIERGRFKAYIPTLVAAEVQFVLFSFYRFARPRIITAMRSIAVIPNLRVYDDVILSHAVSLYEQKNAKFIDCCVASSARVQKGKAAIVSYDRDFDRLRVPRLEPGTLVT